MNNLVMPVTQAKKLIQSANFDWIDKIVLTTNNATLDDSGKKTSVVLTEIDSSPARMGNNSFQGWIFAIEVQIFYKVFDGSNQSFNLLEAEVKLAKLFTDNGWVVNRSDPHVNDPITNQITKTFYFGKKI